MKKAFGYEGYFWAIMNALCDLVEISLLFLICSLPIVTLGASLCATFYVICKKVENSDQNLTRMFFHSWKTNLKQGLLLEVVCCFAFSGSILGFVALLRSNLPDIVRYPLFSLFFLAFLFSYILFSISFMLQARYDDTFIHIIRNSLIAGVRQLPSTILLLVINIVSVLFCIWCTMKYGYICLLVIIIIFPADCLASVMLLKIFFE